MLIFEQFVKVNRAWHVRQISYTIAVIFLWV